MKKEILIVPMNIQIIKETYDAPVIEMVEVKVERGFFQSTDETDDLGSGNGGGRGSY